MGRVGKGVGPKGFPFGAYYVTREKAKTLPPIRLT
jgi:hypothetical protein